LGRPHKAGDDVLLGGEARVLYTPAMIVFLEKPTRMSTHA